jgi:hypothetical protein
MSLPAGKDTLAGGTSSAMVASSPRSRIREVALRCSYHARVDVEA